MRELNDLINLTKELKIQNNIEFVGQLNSDNKNAKISQNFSHSKFWFSTKLYFKILQNCV